MPKRKFTLTPEALAVRWLAAYRGWSRRELAGHARIAETTLYRYATGKPMPGLAALEHLAATAGFPQPVEELLAFCRRVTQGKGASPEGRAASPPPVMGAAADPLRACGEGILRTLLPPAGEPPPRAEDRAAVPGLWARLAAENERDRPRLLEQAPELWSWALCEHLCRESRQAAGRSAAEALGLAQLAVQLAARAPGEPHWCQRLQGFALAHRANARRVGGALPQARRDQARAKRLWQAGAWGDPGLLDAAVALGMAASLEMDDRNLPAALRLLDQALEVEGSDLAAELLISRANVLELQGDYEAAVATLRRAEPGLAAHPRPRALWIQRCALMVNLCHLDRAAEAELLLPEAQALLGERPAELDQLRLDWLHGRIAAGLGRRAEAAERLEAVRQSFLARGIAYDTALVSVELAAVYLEEGRTAEAKAVARQMVPIFRAQGVPAEVIKALRLFVEAVRREAAGAELARRVAAFLYRAQGDPGLGFEIAP